MSLFFEKIDQEPVFIPEEGDWKHFNPNNPYGSIMYFVQELQKIDTKTLFTEKGEILNLGWPYKPL